MKPPTVHQDLGAVSSDKMRFINKVLMELNSLGRCETDEQIRDRINAYFQLCADYGTRPGIETLSVALNVSRTTVYRWAKGLHCSPERQHIIQNALQIIYGFLESLALSGQLNPTTFIWISRNWMSYSEDSFENRIHDRGQNKSLDYDNLAERLGIKDQYNSMIPQYEENDNSQKFVDNLGIDADLDL